jgi:hypothetical protein
MHATPHMNNANRVISGKTNSHTLSLLKHPK